MRNWTRKAEKKYGWTYGGLDIYINDVFRYCLKKKTVTASERCIAPLEWWIKTGRASLSDCKALIQKKPYIIGRILVANENGSYNEIIDAIKKKIMA